MDLVQRSTPLRAGQITTKGASPPAVRCYRGEPCNARRFVAEDRGQGERFAGVAAGHHPGRTRGGGLTVASDQPVKARSESAPGAADEAIDAAEQMLAATEKLRAKLPMMAGGPPGATVPTQATRGRAAGRPKDA